jgi:catechol 2,3-dioxygenase-like lactoylglutathione lyase family enzyme
MAIVRYLVDDVEAALPCYQALGFVVAERWGPAFAVITRGDLTLWISGPATSAAKPLPDGSKPTPGGWNRAVLEVADLDAALADARAAGVRVRSEPAEGPGGRQALLEDASGNPIELFEARTSRGD